MRNLVVSGYYGSKNAGDEAMLAAMLEVLSDLDPKLHITVISADPEDTRERHGVDAVGWLDITAILQLLGHADLLISGGAVAACCRMSRAAGAFTTTSASSFSRSPCTRPSCSTRRASAPSRAVSRAGS